MRIVRVEPTPSPNSMKLTLDTRLNPGVRLNYTKETAEQAPTILRKLLTVPGVTDVYQTADFIALERHPKGEWQEILAGCREILGVASEEGGQAASQALPPQGNMEEEAGFGEVTVRVQTFRQIPMQIRVSRGMEEQRAALPERFQKAAVEAGWGSPNLIMERKLEERGVRYGELNEVLQELMQELDASFDDSRLEELVKQSLQGKSDSVPESKPEQDPSIILDHELELLEDPDWRKRYAVVERLTPGPETKPLLIKALQDENTSVRRLAVVYLGDPEIADSLPYLLQALKDPSPVIRRTAGDTISDRGDPAAAPAMEEALQDPSKLVRWRAARFLYEVGDESSIPALEAASEDPEFEIRLQIQLAIERIKGGEAAQGTVWQQMTRRNQE